MDSRFDPKTHQLTPFFEAKSVEQSRVILEETRLIATWLYQKPENTRLAYESDLKKFFSFYKGKTLKEIETAHFVVYFKNHPEESPATRARLKSAMSSLYNFLIKKRYLERNPTLGLDEIKVPDQTQFRVLSHAAILRMIELEPNERNKIIIRLLYKTGLRVSELCSLRFSNLRERDGQYFIIVVGKGSKTRTIGIDEETFKMLQALRNINGLEADINDGIFQPSKINKNCLSRFAVWKIIKAAAKRAKVDEKASVHWMRHSHATKALEMGEDLRIIQATLGHDSIITTTKYTAVFPGLSSSNKIKF